MTAPDLRPLAEEGEAVSGARVARTGTRAGVPLLLLAAVFTAGGVSAGEPGLLAFAWVLGGIGATGIASALVHRRRPVAVVTTRRGPRGPGTAVCAPPGPTAVGMAMLAVLGLTPAALGVLGLVSGKPVLGGFLLVVAVALLLPVLQWATGRYVAGSVLLDPTAVRYRTFGLESTLAWSDLAVVEWGETDRHVTLHTRADLPVDHRSRAWPRGRRADGPTTVRIRLAGWGLLATDLAHLVVLGAADPAFRAGLGTPAGPATARRLFGVPVRRVSGQWLTGYELPLGHPARPGPDQPPDEPDPLDLPVWAEPANVAASRGLSAYYRGRFFGALGAASLATVIAGIPVVAALPLTGLTILAAGASGLCLSVARLRRFPAPPPDRPDGTADLTSDGVVLSTSRARFRLLVASVALVGVAAGGVAVALWCGVVPADVVPADGARAWALVCGCLAVLLLGAPVLAATRVLGPRSITLTADGLAYRAGLRRWSVPWSQVASARLAWDDVVHVTLRTDGALDAGAAGRRGERTGGRLLDAAGTAASGAQLARALDLYGRQGGPGGETRDPSSVATRLGLLSTARR